MSDIHKALELIGKMRVAKISDFENLSQSRLTLSRLAATGEVVALGAGYYAHPSMDPFIASVIAVARYYPDAIISKATALVIHELTDERIDRIDVDIKRESSIRNRLIRAHRTADNFLIGIDEINYHDQKIRIYDLERTLCEAYRMDPDGEIFLKAMKRYSSSRTVDYEKIATYDKKLSTQVLRAIRQEDADG